MPFYRHRRRWSRRRRLPRRRYIFRRRIPWWRRRFWHRRRIRKQAVRQTKPRWVRNLLIKGVEILGVLGSHVEFIFNQAEREDNDSVGGWNINITNPAPTNKDVSYWQKILPDEAAANDCGIVFKRDGAHYWDFVGGYGTAHFNLQNLIWRTIFGFARFNVTLEGAKFIKFKGFRIIPQRATTIDYLFLASNHHQSHDFIKPLIHPVNLLNTPGTVMVNSLHRTKCCRNPQIKRKADPIIFGWHDLEDFLTVPLASYLWTYYNPNNPMGRNDQITKNLKSPLHNNWMRDSCGKALDTYCPPWMDRTQYDKDFVDCINNAQLTPGNQYPNEGGSYWEYNRQQNITCNEQQVKGQYGKYSPFLPPMAAAEAPQTLWIRYEFYFQIGGGTIGFKRQPWPVREADVCWPCAQPSQKVQDTCQTCIDPERDLDRHGLIKKTSLKRITGSSQSRRRRLVAKLARLIQLRKKQQKRVSFKDPTHTVTFLP